MLIGVTGIAVGMQNRIMANMIHITVIRLIIKPNFPREYVECLTALRPRTRDTRIGMPYDVLRQMVATPVKALNAAVDPK